MRAARAQRAAGVAGARAASARTRYASRNRCRPRPRPPPGPLPPAPEPPAPVTGAAVRAAARTATRAAVDACGGRRCGSGYAASSDALHPSTANTKPASSCAPAERTQGHDDGPRIDRSRAAGQCAARRSSFPVRVTRQYPITHFGAYPGNASLAGRAAHGAVAERRRRLLVQRDQVPYRRSRRSIGRRRGGRNRRRRCIRCSRCS